MGVCSFKTVSCGGFDHAYFVQGIVITFLVVLPLLSSSNIMDAVKKKIDEVAPLEKRLGDRVEELNCDDTKKQVRLQEVLSKITTQCLEYRDQAALAKSLMRSQSVQHAPPHSCNYPCKQALVQYNASRCIDPALRRFPATDSQSKREAFRSQVDVVFQSCFKHACVSIHAQHAALRISQELVGRCRVEIRSWLAGKATEKCSAGCRTVLATYQADHCIANGLQTLGVSDFEKQYFWEMYAHAHDACLTTVEDVPPKTFCEKNAVSISVAEEQINDMMKWCGKMSSIRTWNGVEDKDEDDKDGEGGDEQDEDCSKECRQAYSKFRTAKCSSVVLVQKSFALQVMSLSLCACPLFLSLLLGCSRVPKHCRLRSGICTNAQSASAPTTAH